MEKKEAEIAGNYNKQRIVKNSIFLYLRMLVTMWFNLWATRLVLKNLGVDDMGTYSVVGSIVSLFAVITGGITSAIQRYITYESGKKDGNVNEVFCSSLNVAIGFAVLIIILLEIAGIMFLEKAVNLPDNRLYAAQWVFQLSVLTCVVNLISIPYNALIIAHEKMGAFAWISILQVILGWGAAICLSAFDQENRLIIYAILLTIASLLVRIICQIYCRIKFCESEYHFGINKKLIREISLFTGISTTSNTLQTLSGEGLVFVINWTFGVGINAIYQIALQLKNAVLSFGLNIFKAISPQITKTYAEGNYDIHKKLVCSGSKIEMFMIFIIMVPFLFKTDYILHLWLGNVPQYTAEFCRCTIFLSMTYAGFEPIRTAVMATNNVAKFMIIPESFYLVTSLGLSYMVAKITDSPSNMILTVVILDILTCIIRTVYGVKVSFVKAREIISKVIMPAATVLVLSCITCFLLAEITQDNILQLILFIAANTAAMCIIIYFTGLNKAEKATIIGMAGKILKRR